MFDSIDTSKTCPYLVLISMLFYDLLGALLDSDGLANYEPASKNSFRYNISDTCSLSEADPWDPEILPYLKEPIIECERKYKNAVILKDGKLTLTEQYIPGTDCQYRCHHSVTPELAHIDSWTTIYNSSVKIKCDVVEVRCMHLPSIWNLYNSRESSFYYWNVHLQIHEKREIERKKEDIVSNNSLTDMPSQPSVHLIVLDSVSYPQMIRSLSKTISILKSKYNSMFFPFLNKVGETSRHNGAAFLIGKMQRDPPNNTSFFTSAPNDDTPDDISQLFIGNIFRNHGYKTLFCEDYRYPLFTSEFPSSPGDHVCNPMGKMFIHNFITDTSIYKANCKESFRYQFDFWADFVKAYENKSKFSFIWNTHLNHEDINQLNRMDEYFFNLLTELHPDLKDSYLIIMGDHGQRYGEFRTTHASHREHNNPGLIISVPENTSSEIINNLKSNTDKLVTGFDIYSTLLNILNITHENERGKSLFSPISVRTCDDLQIPPFFCIYDQPSQKVDDEDFISEISNFLINWMNGQLVNYTNCDVLYLDTSMSPIVEQVFLPSITDALRVFKVIISTKPGTGSFWTYIQVDDRSGRRNFTNMAASVFRTNSYFLENSCTTGSALADKFCHCKRSLLMRFLFLFVNQDWFTTYF